MMRPTLRSQMKNIPLSLRAATEAGAQGARLGNAIGRIAPGYRADLTLIDMSDPSWSPCNSAVRQLVHIEAGRGVRHVIVDGTVVVRDRQLTTVKEVRKVDDFTVDFETSAPNALLPGDISTWYIMPKVWSEKNGADKPALHAIRLKQDEGPFGGHVGRGGFCQTASP